MTEESRSLMEEKLISALNGLSKLEPGSPAREVAAKEIELLSKQLNEDLKVQQAAWDSEENRRVDEDIRNKQVEADKFRAKMDLAKGVGVAIVTGWAGLFGIKRCYKFIYKMEADGIIPNREAVKLIPKLKFW